MHLSTTRSSGRTRIWSCQHRLLVIAVVIHGACGFTSPSFSSLPSLARRHSRPANARCPCPRHGTARVALRASSAPREYATGAAEPEDRVVEAIREGVSSVSSATGLGKVTSGVKGVWQLGLESGSLLQSWLTPSRIEDCASFWSEGSRCLVRDISRVALQPQRWSLVEVRSFLVFSVVAVNSFPWTPLLLPLIDRALEDNAPVWPAAFGDRRRSAFRRLSQITQPTQADDGAIERPLFETPQDVNEAAVFLRDGGRIVLRDFRRGRIWRESKEFLSFTALAGTTLPLTPLLFTLIDKWRGDARGARRGDYVPSAFSVRRLAALRRMQTSGSGHADHAETLRAAAAEAREDRPGPAALLAGALSIHKTCVLMSIVCMLRRAEKAATAALNPKP